MLTKAFTQERNSIIKENGNSRRYWELVGERISRAIDSKGWTLVNELRDMHQSEASSSA